MSRTLSELIAEKKELAVLANSNPYENPDPKTLNSRMAAKREAEEKLAKVVEEITSRIQTQVATVFVVGNDEEKLKTAKLVATEMGAVVVSANQLYDQLGLAVQSFAASNGAFVAGCYGGIENALLELLNIYRLQGGVQFNSNHLDVPIKTFDDLRQTIRAVVDPLDFTQNLRALVAATKLVQEAQRLEVTDEPLPVVLLGLKSEDDVALFGRYFYPDRPGVVANVDVAKDVETELKSAAAKLAKLLAL